MSNGHKPSRISTTCQRIRAALDVASEQLLKSNRHQRSLCAGTQVMLKPQHLTPKPQHSTPKQVLLGAYQSAAAFGSAAHQSAHPLRSARLKPHCVHRRIRKRLICNVVVMALHAGRSKDLSQAQAQVLIVTTRHVGTLSTLQLVTARRRILRHQSVCVGICWL